MASIPTTTAPIRSATRRLTDSLRVGAFALAVLLIEVVLAHGVVGPKISHVVYLFVGVLGIALIFRFPLATGLAFLGFTDFIFHPTFFAVQVSAIDFRPHEFALAMLLVLAALRPAKRTWGGKAGAALALFFAFVIISALLAVIDGHTTLTGAFNTGRPLFLLSFFYVVVRLFPDVEQRRVLLTGAAVLAAATGVVAVFAALGAGFGNSLQAPGGQTIRAEGGVGSIERVRLAGLSAGYALFWYTALQITARRGRAKLGWALVLAGISLDILVSFNRNMWLGLVVGLILMATLAGTQMRSRLVISIAVIVAAVAVTVGFGSASTNSHVVEPIIKRGATILSPEKTYEEGSLQSRAEETEIAWRTAKKNLIIGVGVGTPFGVFDTNQVGTTETFLSGFERVPQLFLHNQYLYLLLISGVPGLLAFIFFLGTSVLYALRRRPRDPAIIACGVGITLIALSAIVAIYFDTEDMTAMLGLLAGVIVADAQGRASAGETAGLLP